MAGTGKTTFSMPWQQKQLPHLQRLQFYVFLAFGKKFIFFFLEKRVT
jgi:hypothetical protein